MDSNKVEFFFISSIKDSIINLKINPYSLFFLH